MSTEEKHTPKTPLPMGEGQGERLSVLLAEDEQTLALIIRDTLEAQGFRLRVARDGEEALRMFREEKPDVLVADVMMPRMDGFELVRRIRQDDALTPVLFLTARSAIDDVVRGFELRANDYLKKPFGMQELIVRIKALAGRAVTRQPEPPRRGGWMEVGAYLFNPTAQRLEFAGQGVELSFRESELLRRLCERWGEVVLTRDILLDLWGDDSFFNQRSLHVFITKLRHKLSRDARLRIVNVRGLGYKLLD